jgi:hypothetical protein
MKEGKSRKVEIKVRTEPSGYSGTPLAKKLGFKPGFRVKLINQPRNYLALFEDLPEGLQLSDSSYTKKNLIHYFVTSAVLLTKDIAGLRRELEQDGALWISWPKKSSNVETDLDENIIRAIALDNRLVDVKVCAVDDTWSGLKLVIRVKEREPKK